MLSLQIFTRQSWWKCLPSWNSNYVSACTNRILKPRCWLSTGQGSFLVILVQPQFQESLVHQLWDGTFSAYLPHLPRSRTALNFVSLVCCPTPTQPFPSSSIPVSIAQLVQEIFLSLTPMESFLWLVYQWHFCCPCSLSEWLFCPSIMRLKLSLCSRDVPESPLVFHACFYHVAPISSWTTNGLTQSLALPQTCSYRLLGW